MFSMWLTVDAALPIILTFAAFLVETLQRISAVRRGILASDNARATTFFIARTSPVQGVPSSGSGSRRSPLVEELVNLIWRRWATVASVETASRPMSRVGSIKPNRNFAFDRSPITFTFAVHRSLSCPI